MGTLNSNLAYVLYDDQDIFYEGDIFIIADAIEISIRPSYLSALFIPYSYMSSWKDWIHDLPFAAYDNRKWVTDDKNQVPWPLVKQGSKFGYINNPNYTKVATERHEPCGYWVTGYSKLFVYRWRYQGIDISNVLTVGPTGRDYTTIVAAMNSVAAGSTVLIFVDPGDYSTSDVYPISGGKTLIVKSLGDYTNTTIGRVVPNGNTVVLEGFRINPAVATYPCVLFSYSSDDLTCSKCRLDDRSYYSILLSNSTITPTAVFQNCLMWNSMGAYDIIGNYLNLTKIKMKKVMHRVYNGYFLAWQTLRTSGSLAEDDTKHYYNDLIVYEGYGPNYGTDTISIATLIYDTRTRKLITNTVFDNTDQWPFSLKGYVYRDSNKWTPDVVSNFTKESVISWKEGVNKWAGITPVNW